MIWTHKGMSNWYRNAQGRVVATTPFRNDDYWHMTRKADFSDYRLKTAPAEAAESPAADAEPSTLEDRS
jgi:4-hydroxyacetophenone monooxygenase